MQGPSSSASCPSSDVAAGEPEESAPSGVHAVALRAIGAIIPPRKLRGIVLGTTPAGTPGMKSLFGTVVGVGLGVVAIGCARPTAEPAKAPTTQAAITDEGAAPAGFDRGANIVGTAIAGACEALHGDGKAVSLYTKACTVGDANGCTKAGAYHVCGVGVVQNGKLGTSFLERGCELGDVEACSAFALIAIEGRVIPRDTARAYAVLDKSCSKGQPRACGTLGGMLLASAPAKEHARAVTLLEKGCDQNDLESCTNLGVVFQNGIAGRAKDYARSFALTKKACEGGHKGGCGNLGTFYVIGQGTEKDEALGVKLLNVACDDGDMGSCVTLAKCLQAGVAGTTDPARAESVLKLACSRGNGQACRLLADSSQVAPAPIPASTTFF